MFDSKKYAWSWKIKDEYVDEYVKMHLNPWPEILEEHSRAGIRNYSIFQNVSQFFYCFECDDVQKAFEYLAESEFCRKWNAITRKMVEGTLDYEKSNPIANLQEVFFLK